MNYSNYITTMWNEAFNEIINSRQKFESFLEFHSKIYKHTFTDSLLIYKQRPEALMVGDIDSWNKVDRKIKNNAKPIGVFNTEHTRILKYYDITDTDGSKKPLFWKLTFDTAKKLNDYYCNKYNVSLTPKKVFYNFVKNKVCENIADIPNKTILKNDKIGTFITDCSSFIVAKRLTLNSSFKIAGSEHIQLSMKDLGITDIKTALIVGECISETAKYSINSILTDAKEILRSENNEHSNDKQQNTIQSGLDRSVKQDTESADRSLWSGMAKMDGDGAYNAGSDNEETSSNRVAQHSNESGRGSQTENDNTIRSVRSEDSTTTDNRRELQQLEKKQGTTAQSHSVHRDSLSGKIKKKVTLDNNSEATLSISQEEIDAVLKSGSSFEHGKYRIYNKMKTNATNKEKIDFLKNEYGIGGRSADENGVDSFHDAKGIRLRKGDIFNPDSEITLKWSTVARQIQRFVDYGVYFTKEEKQYYESVYQPVNNAIKNKSIVLINNREFIASWFNSTEVRIEDATLEKPIGHFNSREIDLSEFLPLIQAEKTSENIIEDSKSFDNVVAEQMSFSDFREQISLDTEENEALKEDAKQDIKPIAAETAKIDMQEHKELNEDIQQINSKAPSGAKGRYALNVLAIRQLKLIEKENRQARSNEQSVLSKYCGWGGTPEVFDCNNKQWENEYKELKEVLTEDEYIQARASTLTSFYTPKELTECIYKAISKFGFKGGNVLEPAMGVGNFFKNMPEDMMYNSDLYGVELDSISGRISKQIYQNANIQVQGFEKTFFNENSFDVIASNVPFSDITVSDKKYNKYNFKIHDYFFAKSVDLLKPDGVIAFITSKGTLDKKSSKLRNLLAEKCNLIGAIRLPENAFKQAGTKVVSDIIFLQKRSEQRQEMPDWTKTGLTAEGYLVNQYFIDNPDMVLGTYKPDTRFGDSTDCTVVADKDTDINYLLDKAVSRLNSFVPFKENIVSSNKDIIKTIDDLPANQDVKNFTHTLINNKLYYRENENLTEVVASDTEIKRMKGMYSLCSTLRQTIKTQNDDCTDAELLQYQAKLTTQYDEFKKKFGYINSQANSRCFSHDDNYNLLCTLEQPDVIEKTYKKADIFTHRTINPVKVIKKVDTTREALNVSLDMKGMIDFEYMSSILSDKPIEEIVKELETSQDIFLDPVKANYNKNKYACYIDSGEYLSGDVRHKLKIAELYAKENSEYSRNVAALRNVQPEPLGAGDITAKLGDSWIEIKDYDKFIYSIFNTPTYKQRSTYQKYTEDSYNRSYDYAYDIKHSIHITRIQANGEWKISNKHDDLSVMVTSTFGTSRINGYEIIENLLNQRTITVKDRYDDGDNRLRYVINQKETQVAQEKARQIKEKFSQWFWDDDKRREYYVTKYNDMFNGLRGRDYSNIKMSYPGKSPAITLKPHQNAAIARAVYNGNTLLAHCVGAGKTFEMIAATQEKLRLGIITKACVIVPKHLTLQTAKEWLQLYPQANILVATQKDFSKDNRKRFISKCVTGKYDAIIMAYTQFEKIKMSYDYRKTFLKKQIDTIVNSIQEADEDDRITVKTLERLKKQYEQRFEKLLNEDGKDETLEFEQLGFDSLVVDEAHYYKNCFVNTKMTRVAGISTQAAQKSEDILMKCNYINQKTNYRGILFATGTPVSNSMTELFVMQRYLRPDLLEERDISQFDDWAAQFGEAITKLEMKPACDGYQLKTRFSKFTNLPELMNMVKEYSDIITSDMVDLKIPKIINPENNNKPRIIVVEPGEAQKQGMIELANRTESIHNGNIDPSKDNMLKITMEARLLGLDSRTLFPDAPNEPTSKVNKCISEVMRIYNNTSAFKGTQIIWCDIAINSSDGKFSVYDYIVDELQKQGIPEDEIAKMTDYESDTKKDELFSQFRNGSKRIILASTQKLGTGANIQDRLKAVHHLDIPWKPSDLEQRNGRILRQGNKNDEVEVIHYTTSGTFDAYMLDTVTTKQKFISQIMTSKSPARTCEDVDEMVITYSEMKALTSGNPLIKEKIELDTDVARLNLLKSEYINHRYKLQDSINKDLPTRIESCKSIISKCKQDCDKVKDYNSENFSITFNDIVYTERKVAGQALEKEIISSRTIGDETMIGKLGESIITIESYRTIMFSEMQTVIHVQGKLDYKVFIDKDNPLGNIQRIENAYKDEPLKRFNTNKKSLQEAENDLIQAKAEYDKAFEHEEELTKKTERLKYVDEQLSVKETDEQVFDENASDAAEEHSEEEEIER